MNLLASLLSAALLASLFPFTMACNCGQSLSFLASFCNSRTAVIGRPTKILQGCPSSNMATFGGSQFTTYVVDILYALRGTRLPSKSFLMTTSTAGNMCGSLLDMGELYVFGLSTPFAFADTEKCPQESYELSACNEPSKVSHLSSGDLNIALLGEFGCTQYMHHESTSSYFHYGRYPQGIRTPLRDPMRSSMMS